MNRHVMEIYFVPDGIFYFEGKCICLSRLLEPDMRGSIRHLTSRFPFSSKALLYLL